MRGVAPARQGQGLREVPVLRLQVRLQRLV